MRKSLFFDSKTRLDRNSLRRERLFQAAIQDKRRAEESGNRHLANEIEERIQELGRARIKVPREGLKG